MVFVMPPCELSLYDECELEDSVKEELELLELLELDVVDKVCFGYTVMVTLCVDVLIAGSSFIAGIFTMLVDEASNRPPV